ncbi:MAG: sigma-70 family RNA polymerase sigma factor [Planctomycetes bacterium]|nr:sigma-70 family RNA polymerase sigma factor [Planctomycetota bacterium]
MESLKIKELLGRAESGDRIAADQLYEVLYDDLRTRAHLILDRKAAGVTLQPTVLVHEAWLKLMRREETGWNDRAHFLRVAAKAMRSILVDHARSRKARKRGSDRTRVELEHVVELYEQRAHDLVSLDDALARLTAFDAELGRLVELRFFGGLTIEETARVLGVSASTVERGWRTARAWLKAELHD